MTSTYGEITSFEYDPNKGWEEDYCCLKGHGDSVFGIGSTEGKYIATGDYRGNVIIWEFSDKSYKIVQKLGVAGNIQDLCWHNEKCFAVITDTGKIYVIESMEEKKWQIVVQVDAAKDRGVCIRIAEDGKTVFAGTHSEIIQFDLDLHQFETIPGSVKKIFSRGTREYVLNNKGLYAFEVRPIEIAEELVKYRFVKISLLGHTGTGKTTFCRRMMNDSIDNIFSTFGKKIFNLTLQGEEEAERRIIFHDHGGQETVLDTFIPFLRDSDIILIFYKQTDKDTFVRAREILEEVRDKVGGDVSTYLVQTFIDHTLDEIPYREVNSLVESHAVVGLMKLSPTNMTGFDLFEKETLGNIDWGKARVMIQSPFTDGISRAFSVLQKKGYPVVLFENFRDIYQEVVGERVSERHLKFLLEDYTNQGVIEFYPDISKLIIFNSEEFNRLRSDVPIYVDQMKGVVDIKDLLRRFDNEEFLKILDEMYIKSRIAVQNGELRIFPHKLPEETLEIHESYKAGLVDKEQIELFVDHKRLETDRLIQLLSELELQCIAVTKWEGLFAWEQNAFIYYFIYEERRGFLKRYFKFTFLVGGNKPRTKERLKREFSMIVERLYGPIVDTESEAKKKAEEEAEFVNARRKIQEYKRLVNDDAEEPTFQRFFEETPSFLDPRVRKSIPKKSFAGEGYPDFLLILHDSSYLLVEIEKPSVRLFNKMGDPTYELTHAQQQIRDYLRWAIEEKEFLRKRGCPNISADNTKGLVVIGKSSNLTTKELSKLENINAEVRSRYLIKTFDKILEAEIILNNLRKKAER